MNVSKINLGALDAGLGPIAENLRSPQTAQNETSDQGENAMAAKNAADAIHISFLARSLSAGSLGSLDEAMKALENVAKGIQDAPDRALSAHAGLDAYRVNLLLSGLE